MNGNNDSFQSEYNEIEELRRKVALQSQLINDQQALISQLKEQNKVLQASLNVGMGVKETNESALGGPTPQDIIMEDAKKEDIGRSFL